MKQVNQLKNFIRRQISTRASLRVVRDATWSMRAKRDHAAVLAIGKKLNLQPLLIKNFSMSDTKSHNTLFILGSGSSINELTDSNFEEIRDHISVGINVWVAHDFIPDVYSLESRSLPITPLEYEQNLYRGEKLNRDLVVTSRPKFLILRPSAPSIAEQFVPIPEALRDRAFLYGRVNLPEVDKNLAASEVERCLNRFLRKDSNRYVLPDNGASVIRLIFLGLKLGFEKIVLLGIDLNQNPYFWFHPDWLRKRPELAVLFPRTSGVPHETTQTQAKPRERRPYNTSEVIRHLDEALKRSHNSRLFTGSSSSALASFLPLYSWRS